ncbi:rCG55790 [Rattus norvegicus]|uniref:RCG55790 n=1 Tax=Rattus norvegicus TaxID=10116 RepID=A6JLQ3_RAT|nr:rCG55790 [Rattus norvegicus]
MEEKNGGLPGRLPAQSTSQAGKLLLSEVTKLAHRRPGRELGSLQIHIYHPQAAHPLYKSRGRTF